MITMRRVTIALLAFVALSTAANRAESDSHRWSLIARADATIGSIAAQLGVKVSERKDEAFNLGVQFTGSLEDPQKLETFGIKGMRSGARVVAARIAQAIVLVEADEIEPVKRANVRLTLGVDGTLAVPAKPPTP